MTMATLPPWPTAKRFLVADDHPMVRDALASALGQTFVGAQFSMAGTLAQAQAALDRQPTPTRCCSTSIMPAWTG